MVLDFLSFVRKYNLLADDFSHDVYFEQLENARSYYEFPFFFEDIPDLFKGWDKSKLDYVGDDMILMNTNGKASIISYVHKDDFYTIRADHNSQLRAMPLPNNKNDFINDCKRCGVVLEWNITWLLKKSPLVFPNIITTAEYVKE